MNPNPPIVVGVDRSPAAEWAVRWAAADAARHGAPLLLANVIPTVDMFVPALSDPPIDYRLAEHAGRALLRVAESAAGDAVAGIGAVDVSTEVHRGAVTPVLLKLSKEARMVVVGSRGMGALGRGLLGSVSTALPRHAQCPVAVVHAYEGDVDPTPRGRVVVGVDGSRNSVPAVEIAFDEASTRGAELVAVHAWTDASEAIAYGAEWSSAEKSEELLLVESLAGWAERYPEVVVRFVVVADRPTRKLLEESAAADLVVVGSHGRGGFAGMTLGSVSQALLHSVTCPIIIARNPM